MKKELKFCWTVPLIHTSSALLFWEKSQRSQLNVSLALLFKVTLATSAWQVEQGTLSVMIIRGSARYFQEVSTYRAVPVLLQKNKCLRHRFFAISHFTYIWISRIIMMGILPPVAMKLRRVKKKVFLFQRIIAMYYVCSVGN